MWHYGIHICIFAPCEIKYLLALLQLVPVLAHAVGVLLLLHVIPLHEGIVFLLHI